MNDAGYDVEPFEMDLSSRESILAILILSFWTAMERCMGRLRSIRQLKELSAIVMTSSSWKVRVRKCFCRTSAAIASVIPLQPGCAKPVRISSSCKISLGIRISRLPWTFMLMWRRSCAKKSWAIWKFISRSKRNNDFIKDREVLLKQEGLPLSAFIPIFCRIYWKMSLSVL